MSLFESFFSAPEMHQLLQKFVESSEFDDLIAWGFQSWDTTLFKCKIN